MRQVLESRSIKPSEAGIALGDIVVSTRPWQDEAKVARALRGWATRYWGEGSLDPGLADGAGSVAEQLRYLGLASPPPDDPSMIGITFHLLRNVARGRPATQYDMLGDHVFDVPSRTMRRYRERARAAGDSQGISALHLFLSALQFDLDVAALVQRGRTPGAARRWLERHPGEHAEDAPPPRRRSDRS